MNKIFPFSLLAASAIVVLGSCASEEADIFEHSAAERLNEAKATFTQRLASSPNGWAFEYFVSPETDADNYVKGLGYLMMVNLKADGSVVAGMKNYHTNDEYWEEQSLWEVITDMSAVLSFNSYNKVIHRFSEPENFLGSTSYGGDIGKGMLGDYEFVIVEAEENSDFVYLKGKKHGAYSRLTRLHEDCTFEDYLKDVNKMQKTLLSKDAPNHLVMNVGEKQYNFIMPGKGGDLGLTKLWPAGTDSTFTMVLNPFIMSRRVQNADTTYVVRFRDVIEGSDENFKGQDFYYDPKTQSFTSDIEGVNIVGEEPTVFFAEKWIAGARFSMTRTSGGSDSFKTIIDAVFNGYSSIKYTFQNAQLQMVEDGTGATLTINYRTNKNASGKAVFDFTSSLSANGELTLGYVGPNNTASETQANSIPAIKDLCNALSGTFTFAVGNSALNLSTITFNKNDGSLSVVSAYVK